MVAPERQIFAVVGRPLVLPLVPAARGADGSVPSGWTPSRMPELTGDDGVKIPAGLYYIAGETRPAAEGEALWLPPTASWSAYTLEEVQRRKGEEGLRDPTEIPGFWALLIEPPGLSAGRGLRLDGIGLPLVWISGVDSKDLPSVKALDAAPGEQSALGKLLRDEARDPLRAWRVRLLQDRFMPAWLWGGNPPARLGSPVLEALASQNELRWRAALRNLRSAGSDTAMQVRSRLTAVVNIPEGTLLPAWPLEDGAMLQLRATLLDPSVSVDQRLNAAQNWLGDTSAATAWITDESSDGEPVSVASGDGKAELRPTRRVQLVISDHSGAAGTVEIIIAGVEQRRSVRLPAHDTVQVLVDVPLNTPRLECRRGAWSQQLPVLSTDLRAAPPGLAIGPFFEPWTMISWMSGQATLMTGDWATAALLQRSSTTRQWELYLECRVPVGFEAVEEPGAPDDAVILWLQTGGTVTPLEITRSSEIIDGRWTAIVPILNSAIKNGTTLRFGLERRTPTGLISTWPRPILPGQGHRSKAVIDLTAWSEPGSDPQRPGDE